MSDTTLPELPPLPVKFKPLGACTCAGPDGPCENCISNREAYDEWLTEPQISPREAIDYGRACALAAITAERARAAAAAGEATSMALEFAEYMAKGAEQLLEAINAEDVTMEDDAPELFERLREARCEFMSGLRSDIYEFRKRAALAEVAPAVVSLGAPPSGSGSPLQPPSAASASIPSAVCPECDGTGLRDSGGTLPWGEAAMLPCECKYTEVGRRWFADSSLKTWFPLTAERLASLEQWARDCRDLARGIGAEGRDPQGLGAEPAEPGPKDAPAKALAAEAAPPTQQQGGQTGMTTDTTPKDALAVKLKQMVRTWISGPSIRDELFSVIDRLAAPSQAPPAVEAQELPPLPTEGDFRRWAASAESFLPAGLSWDDQLVREARDAFMAGAASVAAQRPASDADIAEHMRLVREYGLVCWSAAQPLSSHRVETARAAVEASARRLAKGR